MPADNASADNASVPDLVRELDRTIDDCVQAAWRAYHLHEALRERGVPVPALPHGIRFASDIDLPNTDHSVDEPFWWAMVETPEMFDANF